MSTDNDPHVADAIERRRVELGLTPGQFADRSGVTAPGLAPLRKGERKAYSDTTKFGVAHALRWPRDAVDRLFDGDTPDETWNVTTSSDGSAVLAAIDNDPQLDDAGRDALRTVYAAVAKASQRGDGS